MSVMWVSRLTSLLSRCERSPTPVSVGENTLWPFFSSRSDTRRQHQPPCQAPCTSTKVFGALVCAIAGVPPKAAALAPAVALASTPRRVIPFVSVMSFLPMRFLKQRYGSILATTFALVIVRQIDSGIVRSGS